MTDSDPAHPNPPLERSRRTPLDGPWRFLNGDERTVDDLSIEVALP